jgi:hypothetical protein
VWPAQVEYSFRNAWQGALPPTARVGAPATLLDVDMHTVTFAELFGWERRVTLPSLAPVRDGAPPVQLLCGWFDVRFCADGASEGGTCVELTTAPTEPYTHWAHTTLVLERGFVSGTELSVSLVQSARSHHDLNVTVAYDAHDGGALATSFSITAEFKSAYDKRSDDDGRDERYNVDITEEDELDAMS